MGLYLVGSVMLSLGRITYKMEFPRNKSKRGRERDGVLYSQVFLCGLAFTGRRLPFLPTIISNTPPPPIPLLSPLGVYSEILIARQ